MESALNLAQNYTSSLKKHIFENTEKDNSKNKYETKIENRFVKLCAEFNADLKTVFVFLLALIVFDFYSFEKKKNRKFLIFSKTIPKYKQFSRTK